MAKISFERKKCHNCGTKIKWSRVDKAVSMLLVITFILTLIYVKPVFSEASLRWQLIPSLATISTHSVQNLTNKVVSGCDEVDSYCKYRSIYNYVMMNVEQKGDTPLETVLSLNNDPISTLENGNDCEGIAILLVSMFKAAGIKDNLYIVSQHELDTSHACVMADTSNGYMTFNCAHDMDIVKIDKV